jgi:serine/threonine-protein kinase HipA
VSARKPAPGTLRQAVDIRIGQRALPVGELVYAKAGPRVYSEFAYSTAWLENPDRFEVSPDLALVPGYTSRKAPSRDDSCFPAAFADTEPDAWGRRVINRAHAKARKVDKTLPALTEFDYLTAVDDFSRVGALRLCDKAGDYLRTVEAGKRTTPPLVELERLAAASRAVELSQETAEDLQYLQGRGTSLGGMRPKCTLLDTDGTLAIGKFPSIDDARDVTRGEVLALLLANRAGIEAASARITVVGSSPVAVIRRFDRTPGHARIHYLSAGSMLQASHNEERAYTEVVDIMRAKCADPAADAKALWRRLVFNLLITNVDDHLRNLGFLHVGKGLWRLAPAFDLNPFPDKDRESKTWLAEDTGPITDLAMLMEKASCFHLDAPEARRILGEVHRAVKGWRTVARSPAVGLKPKVLDDFAPAFEHEALEEAEVLLGR